MNLGELVSQLENLLATRDGAREWEVHVTVQPTGQEQLVRDLLGWEGPDATGPGRVVLGT